MIGTSSWTQVGNPVLSDISALANLDAGSISGLIIGGNSSLSDCAIQSICDYLASPNGTTYIYFNATGCNSPEQVEEACLTKVSEQSAVINRQSSVSTYPNPTSGIVDLQFTIYSLQSVLIKIYDVQGREVAVLLDDALAAGEHTVRWDSEGLPAGIYFYRLQTANCELLTGKIVKY